MANQFSTITKTILLIMFCSTMIAHHWSWDEVCDLAGGDEAHEGGVSTNVDDVIDSDAKGHYYSFAEPNIDCTKDNNTDNRAYLAFYIITMVTALIGLCCLFCETGENIFGGCLVFLFLWYLIMEGLRVQKVHEELAEIFNDEELENDVARVYLSFFVGQFCLYCSLFVGLALELFNIPCFQCACACVRTVVVKQKAVIQV